MTVGPDYIFISQNDTAFQSAINANGMAQFVCAVGLLPSGAVKPPLLNLREDNGAPVASSAMVPSAVVSLALLGTLIII